MSLSLRTFPYSSLKTLLGWTWGPSSNSTAPSYFPPFPASLALGISSGGLLSEFLLAYLSFPAFSLTEARVYEGWNGMDKV